MGSDGASPLNGKWLLEQIKISGFATQLEFATASGLDGPKFTNLLQGKRRVQLAEVSKMAKLLDMPEQELLKNLQSPTADGHKSNVPEDNLRGGLIAFRDARGMTTSGWCISAGISEGVLRNFFSCRSETLTYNTLHVLAAACRLSVVEMLTICDVERRLADQRKAGDEP